MLARDAIVRFVKLNTVEILEDDASAFVAEPGEVARELDPYFVNAPLLLYTI
jgi:hypothetical protein